MRHAGRAWGRFWFEPQPTSAVAVYRIVFGALCFFWTLSLLPDLDTFFAPGGIEPQHPFDLANGIWGVLSIVDTRTSVLILFVALLASSLCLLVGYRTRLASVLVFIGIVSFMQRTPSIFNAGDVLIRTCAFFFMFIPAGASFSVDRWRNHRDDFWVFPARAPWAVRLIQVQVSVVYLASVWEKLHGAAWRNGTAVSLSLGLQDFQRFAAPGFVVHSLLVSTVMTYLTLAIELMIGLLVWNRAARPLVFALGASLHLGIDTMLRVGFFSEAILSSYLAFLSPVFAAAALLALRDRLQRAAATRTLEPQQPSAAAVWALRPRRRKLPEARSTR